MRALWVTGELIDQAKALDKLQHKPKGELHCANVKFIKVRRRLNKVKLLIEVTGEFTT